MSRSVKKGPFVDEKLLARICQMNEKNEKKVLKYHFESGFGQQFRYFCNIFIQRMCFINVSS